MLPTVLLGIALLVGFYLLTQAFMNADPKSLARTVRYTGIVVGIVVVVFLAVTGRLGMAMAFGAFLLPLFMRWRGMMNRFKAARGPTSGQVSTVETPYLRMHLEHDSGRMSGEVLAGSFEGRSLDDLSLDELLQLLDECERGDAQSASVLETYLDRTWPGDWRKRAGREQPEAEAQADAGPRHEPPPRGNGAMTRAEAYAILGIEPGASREEIKEAHRHLMLKLHPDQGGSTYLAAKINQAKDLLLRP